MLLRDLLPDTIVYIFTSDVVVEGDDVHDRLRIALLLIPGDAAVLQHALPFLGQSLQEISIGAMVFFFFLLFFFFGGVT